MKNYIIIFLIFALLLASFPFLYSKALAPNFNTPENISVFIESEKKIISLSIEEYIEGCLFAEIPVNYSQETLKAQAAAAHTFALRLISDYSERKDELFSGADISDSAELCQPYFTEEAAKEYYMDDYEKYLNNVQEAAQYGANHVVVFEGQPIYAVYHSVSAGYTNSAKNVWGIKLPYLVPVESKADRSFINYETKNEYTTDEMRRILLNYDRSLNMPLDYSKWFSNFNADERGYVISLTLGDRSFSGGDIWRIFGLRSTAFSVEFDGSVFIFTTKGYGHCVGMSQYGAEQMALDGANSEEILRYYYSGADIKAIR